MGAKNFDFDGQAMPVFYGMKAMEELLTPELVKAAESGNLHAIKWFKDILFVGLKEGARKEKMKFEIKKEDLDDLVDENFESVEKVYDLFMKSRERYDQLFNSRENGLEEKK